MTWNHISLKPLEHCESLKQIGIDLDNAQFNQSALRAFPGWNIDHLMLYRKEASIMGDRLHLMIFDQDRALGWIGLVMKEHMESSIFLHPDLWGTGFSVYGYQILWHIGHHILGYPEIVASVDVRNEHSVAAHNKLYPHVKKEQVYEPKKERTSVNFYLNSYPHQAVNILDHAMIKDLVQPLAFTQKYML